MMHGYQRKRIDVFLDPESDPLGAGYHIAQSKIAIGSGGIWGKGFLQGSQSHLDYLPEGHTDFVFATMAEEWGLVGGVVLIVAFGLVIRWGIKVSSNSRTPLRAADCGGTHGHDLLLCRDQPDDGDGSRAGRRRSPPPRQLRRISGDDGDAVPRPFNGSGTPAADRFTSRLRPRGCTPPEPMLPARRSARRDQSRSIRDKWTHSSVGRAARLLISGS